MHKFIVHNQTLELYTESFGSSNDPALILIMGASGSSQMWEDEFCENLARKKFFVIRYDNRDTGQSTTGKPGELSYTIEDMADDCLTIALGYHLKSFHLAGLSLGGMIAQVVALKAPDKILSLSILSSSAWADLPNLPGIEPSVMDELAKGANLDWTDRKAFTEYFANNLKVQAGGLRHPFDRDHAIKISEKEFDHAKNIQSSVNHAQLSGAEKYFDLIAKTKIPTLIIHGSKDPVLPIEHGQALQRLIPSSKLFILEKGGHEVHPNDFDEIAEIIHANANRN
ncbi:MAG: alpha/beta hydrolase [Proteobacteria bacterium]|nr:MAG: alpha/beta hydrolase [Pseudomonadota bacterium]